MKWLFDIGQTIAEKFEWLPPLTARLTVGAVFIQAGWAKFQNLPRVVDFFRDLQIPLPEFHAPLVASVELVCGVLVLAGLASRIAAVPLVITMIVAITKVKAPSFGSWTELFGLSEFLYAILLSWIVIAGPGALSADRLMKR